MPVLLPDNMPWLRGDVPLDIRRTMYYQHDGCPAQFSLDVRNPLDDIYPNK